MRTTRSILLALICMTTLQLWAAESAPPPLSETLKTVQAVAFVRVTHATEELRDNRVLRTATFTLCGRETGLGDQTQFDIVWDLVPPSDGEKQTTKPPLFSVGDRCVILLVNREGHWETVRHLGISVEGKLQEENVGTEIGLQAGLEANVVVQMIEVQLKNTARRSTQRIAPPSARNQPWKLMRTSPLRRIWPFFPH
jgi:hypothetical protein